TNLKDSFVTDGNNSRILTRNSNTAYTDYGSYWEAMIVRRPFSDSFVDSEELQQFSHVQHLRDGLTPNWNMVYGVPVVHGYTALLPQDYAHLWQTSVNPRINFIDRIEPDNDLLKQWAVKYYLVDAWFDIQEDLTRYPLVAEYKNWSLYELPTLTRFRFGDATSAELKDFNETPNQISFLVDNQTNQSQLIMADRYDVNWLAKVNGEKVEIENYQDMRMIEIQPGKNEVRFYYYPRLFYLGLVISGLTLLGSLMSLLISKRFKLRKTHT
ncbi:YfhO family protein, partial [Patescibacteria group bacterium]|nr:YfhO family protein [Patescibacteria group bacterium]MBU1966814.1 YfhO family protein [Patescibacteria group bacterium]